MTSFLKTTAIAAAFVIGASAAQAATVTISALTGTNFDEASAGAAAVTVEDFETIGAANGNAEIASDLSIAVGTVGVIAGGQGGGSSHIGTGTELATRNGTNAGRTNTTDGGEWFLDSNDTFGSNLTIDGQVFNYKFNRVFFTLTDAADAGAVIRVTESTGGVFDTALNQVNANQKLVVIDFENAISIAKIEIGNVDENGLFVINDGYGVDDIVAAFMGDENELEPVPLPAGGLLLLTALGGLGIARRRKAARKAA